MYQVSHKRTSTSGKENRLPSFREAFFDNSVKIASFYVPCKSSFQQLGSDDPSAAAQNKQVLNTGQNHHPQTSTDVIPRGMPFKKVQPVITAGVSKSKKKVKKAVKCVNLQNADRLAKETLPHVAYKRKPSGASVDLTCREIGIFQSPLVNLPRSKRLKLEQGNTSNAAECQSSHSHQDKGSFHYQYHAGQFTNPKQSTFVVQEKEMQAFFRLTDDIMIADFLDFDSCHKISDKYLLAMVFAYFKRSNLCLREYTRHNFFIALYLANDMEEDEEELKYEIFPWALGQRWRDKYPKFLRQKDRFWRRIDYRGVVSCKCCEEIMAIEKLHPLWRRERPLHHAGAIRSYSKDLDDDGYPRGPNASPVYCRECDEKDSQYDSASPASTSWYISSEDSYMDVSSPTASFDMKGLQETLHEDNIWATAEE